MQNESKHLRALLFRKVKHPVDRDLWIPGASEPGLVPRGGLRPALVVSDQSFGSLLTSLSVALPSWQDDREGRCALVQKLSQYTVTLPLFVRRNDGPVA